MRLEIDMKLRLAYRLAFVIMSIAAVIFISRFAFSTAQFCILTNTFHNLEIGWNWMKSDHVFMLYATFRRKFWGCPVSPAKPSHWSSSSMHLQKWSSLTCGWRTKHHPNAIHYPVLSFQHLCNKFQSTRPCETSKRRLCLHVQLTARKL